jgi:diguanylate cyclase (GGDEF)-like protein
VSVGSAPTAGGLNQRRLAALHQVSLAATAVLDPAELARVVLDEAVRIFAAERAFLFLVGPDGDTLEPYLGRDSAGVDTGEPTGYGSTLVERVRESRTSLVVTGSEEGAALGSQSTMVHGLRSIMVSPLLVKGRLLGVVYLDSRVARGIFTGDDVELLVAVTHHFAVSLETARAAQLELAVSTAHRERDLAERLRRAVADLGATLDPDEVLRRLLSTVAGSLPVDRACVVLTAGGTATVAAVLGGTARAAGATVEAEAVRMLRAGPGRGTATTRPDVVVYLLGPAVDGWLAVGLTVRGEPHGVLVAGSSSTPRFGDAEAEIAAALAAHGMTAYDNARLFRRVEDLAVRDALTGLFNRRHFFDLGARQFAAARRYTRPLAALMVDIDRFKAVNDTYGHAAGDAVIRAVGARIAATLRGTDLLCRYGGEEFAIVLVETGKDPDQVGERLRAAVEEEPVETDAGPVRVTVSVGAVELESEHATLEALLRAADGALYEAKRAGRNRVVTAP